MKWNGIITKSAMASSEMIQIWHDSVIYESLLPAGSVFTHDVWVFRPAGAKRCTDQGEIWHGRADRRSARTCQISPWSIQGWGLRPPKLEKKWNFTNTIAPKGRVHWTIFTKFIIFMRVISLHNSANFSCFISINDKIINNFLRWGRFQPNFQRPLAAKLWMGAKKVWT